MPSRFLLSSGDLSAAPPPPPESSVVVILAAMLCALICVIGLALVALCAWLRRRAASVPPAVPSKGLKKKVLKSLPSFSFNIGKDEHGEVVECAICLAEFAEGEEIRILPQCGHRFHVACVDTWLGGHSSCPSCRRVLVVPTPARCSTCGGTQAG